MNYNKEYVENLKESIKKADFEYYVLGNPSLSDAQYDRMYQEYVEYETAFPELKTADSPTLRVGGEPLDKFEKTTHRSPLLSIDQKAKTAHALKSFYENCGGEGTEILIQPKFDGLTVNNTYQESFLVEAATRGNGYVGEVITDNVKTIRSVPLSIPFKGTMEIRGEAVVDIKSFFENFSEEYSNPRNFVSGTMRQLDSKIVAQRKADIVFYDIGICDYDFKTNTDSERLEWLKAQGFKVTPYILVNSMEALLDVCTSGMNSLIYQTDGFNVLHKNDICSGNIDNIVCDGLVLKVNDLHLREELGMTAKGPKWAFAYKFKSIQATTKLNEVVWQVGRTGKLTPVAIFDTVNIGGTSVSRATLNNIDYIKKLEGNMNEITFSNFAGVFFIDNEKYYSNDIEMVKWFYNESVPESKPIYCELQVLDKYYYAKFTPALKDFCNLNSVRQKNFYKNSNAYELKIGDDIVIERSNDVIPRIIAINLNKENNNPKNIVVPAVCPVCGEPIKEVYPQHFCSNISCPARLKGSLIQFVSRDAMNIEGLGKANLDVFVSEHLINSIYDIYTLKEKEEYLLKLEGFGQKKVAKILASIEKSKKETLDKFLLGLGIEEVGKSMAKSLAKHFGSIDNFMNAQKEDLLNIEDVGEVVANYIMDFVSNPANIELIKKLKEIGFSFEHNNTLESTRFTGKTFVITGTLKEKRNYYQKIIEDNGGKISSSVSPKTFAVIIGEDAGSKETKARELVSKGNNILIIEGHQMFEQFMDEN